MKKYKAIFKSLRLVLSAAPAETIISVICYLLVGLSPSVISLSIGSIVNLIADGAGLKTYYIYIIALIATMLIVCICNFLLAVCNNAGVFEKSNAYCRKKIIQKTAGLRHIDYEDVTIIEKKTCALDSVDDEAVGMIFMSFIQFVANIISLVTLAITLASYSWLLVLVSFLSVIPFLFVRIVRGQIMYNVRRANLPAERKVDYFFSLFNNASTVKDIRLLGVGVYLKDRWKSLRYQVNEVIRSKNKKEAIIVFICEMITVLGLIAAIIMSIIMSVNKVITIGALSACIYAFQSMQGTAQQLFGNLGKMTEYSGYVTDYFDFLYLKEQPQSKNVAVQWENAIRFRDVSFSYPNSTAEALSRLSIDIPKGQVVALVGENGSGKTTFSKLLSGIYCPDSGEVLYDNCNTADMGEDLSELIGVVAQSPTHFSLTVAENVTMGENNCDERQVKTVLNNVGLEKISQNLNKQLGKEFGGVELSGGEWQKLAIARCIYKDAPIVVLDEPTSALDPIMEVSVLKKFIELSKGKTSLIISHRIGICKYADRVIVLKDGRVIEDGTHADLINLHGVYYEMYNNQSQYYN